MRCRPSERAAGTRFFFHCRPLFSGSPPCSSDPSFFISSSSVSFRTFRSSALALAFPARRGSRGKPPSTTAATLPPSPPRPPHPHPPPPCPHCPSRHSPRRHGAYPNLRPPPPPRRLSSSSSSSSSREEGPWGAVSEPPGLRPPPPRPPPPPPPPRRRLVRPRASQEARPGRLPRRHRLCRLSPLEEGDP